MEAVLIFVCFMVLVFFVAAKSAKEQKRAKERIKRLKSDYQPDEFYLSVADGSLIGLNFDSRMILLGTRKAESSYSFSQIVTVEVLENGTTINQTNRGSQMLGAAVGGLMFGGVGAVVGGLSGSSRSNTRTTDIQLKVVIDDRLRPSHLVCFLKSKDKKGLKVDDSELKAAQEAVSRFHAHLLAAMRQDYPKKQEPAQLDDLQKIWEMKQQGILTEQEFAQQKELLLGRAGGISQVHPPSQPAESQTYTVVLKDKGGMMPVSLLKELKELLPELSRKEINQMALSTPSVVVSRVSRKRAESVTRAIERTGATADCSPDMP